ncbi:MAG: aromatic acid exporter family protein [Mobilitalea sp.]
MKKVFGFFSLDKEAYLFDSRLYIIKAMAAVLATYLVVQHLPLVNKDLISVLFGLMMTLEPVTVTGIRSGLRQIVATLIGAIVTAVIISVFGISIWTSAISISATLFVCLKINWREVSPVAIFTSIYMTNFIQYTANGDPSIPRTFELRVLALGIGILMAVLFNFLFSLFFYRRMERKRIAHIVSTLTGYLEIIKNGLELSSMAQVEQMKESIQDTFKGIDWLVALVRDKEKEAKIKHKILFFSKVNGGNTTFQEVLIALRNISHLIYDTAYSITNPKYPIDEKDCQAIIVQLSELIEECNYVATQYREDAKNNKTTEVLKAYDTLENKRINDNLDEIREMLNIINYSLKA